MVPQVVNAVLSKHNFILLGLRGQAKTKLIRMLVTLLDEHTPYIAGCEIRDNPFAPICWRVKNSFASTATLRRSRGCRANNDMSKSLRRRTSPSRI